MFTIRGCVRDLQKRIILYGGVSEEAAVIGPGSNRAPNTKLEPWFRERGYSFSVGTYVEIKYVTIDPCTFFTVGIKNDST